MGTVSCQCGDAVTRQEVQAGAAACQKGCAPAAHHVHRFSLGTFVAQPYAAHHSERCPAGPCCPAILPSRGEGRWAEAQLSGECGAEPRPRQGRKAPVCSLLPSRRRADQGCRRVCDLPGGAAAGGHDSQAALPLHLSQKVRGHREPWWPGGRGSPALGTEADPLSSLQLYRFLV